MDSTQNDTTRTSGASSWAEEFTLRGNALSAKVKELLHEGNVRRITVRNDRGDVVMEIPVTAGVIAAVLAPVLAVIGALAALASDWKIEVQRSDDDSDDPPGN